MIPPAGLHHSQVGIIIDTMTTVAVQLDDDLKRFVDESIQHGDFLGASELVAVALQNLRAEQAGQEAKLQALRRDIGAGIEQADHGEFVEFDARTIIAEAQSRRNLLPLNQMKRLSCASM